MLYDDKLEDMDTTKQSADQIFEPRPQKIDDELFDQDVDDFKNELNQELEVLNNENKEEKVKILRGVYRDGEDFLQDFCNEQDRELMRMFPPITESDYTKIIIDSSQGPCDGRRILNNV